MRVLIIRGMVSMSVCGWKHMEEKEFCLFCVIGTLVLALDSGYGVCQFPQSAFKVTHFLSEAENMSKLLFTASPCPMFTGL